MNILICPDKFKGSLTSFEVCEALSKGILRSRSEFMITSHPLADGGEGSVALMSGLLNLKSVTIDALDPLGRKIILDYSVSDDTAYIELASASGLQLLGKKERNPLLTSTKGTGLQLRHAIENGFEKIYLFVGGSATNDAGIGIAQALGFEFLSKDGLVLKTIGKNLGEIQSIANNHNFDFSKIELVVLTDVSNPMYGPNGAAFIYAAQKGASSEDIKVLDQGLKNYAEILNKQFNVDVGAMAGIGAAGAVGASLVALMSAKLKNGFNTISELTDLENKIKNADLVITGEGQVDSSSFQGKVVGGVSRLCKKHKVPCGIVAGSINNFESRKGQFAFSKTILSRAFDINDAFSSAHRYLEEIGQELGKGQ